MISLEALYNIYIKNSTICIDTRKISEKCLFFALKGENFDGNTFAQKALDLGAAYVIIDNPDYFIDEKTILVSNVLHTLQSLAQHHRSKLEIPVIGLTGSNGKTTTKELIKTVLSTTYKTFATEGNLNNHIGVPLSVLSIKSDIEIAIIEMGANHQQEITFLSTIAQPTHGLITNIGRAHLEGFGGFEGVKLGKSELYKYLSENNGVVFINSENTVLVEMANKYSSEKEYYGSSKNSTYGDLIEANPYLKLNLSLNSKKYDLEMHITGAYNFENVLAAAFIGQYFKITPTQITTSLAGYMPTNNRSQVKLTDHNTVICDFYNANPSSMFAALLNLTAQKHNKKVSILGDMFELGSESLENHKAVIDTALEGNFDQTIFIGPTFYALKADKGIYFKSIETAIEAFTTKPIKNSVVLIKGSRGMALEQLLPFF